MLIINNPEYDVPQRQNSTNNYLTTKPKIELMSDKFFHTRSTFKKSEPDPVSTISNINKYISLTTKYQSKEKTSGKSEDFTSGIDIYKTKLNRSHKFNEDQTSVEQIVKIEDIKSLTNALRYMTEENARRLNSNYCKELINLSSAINNVLKK